MFYGCNNLTTIVIPNSVTSIENGDYEYAYKRYKESILSLKNNFIKDNNKNFTV